MLQTYDKIYICVIK